MNVAVAGYPWDVARLSPRTVVEELAELGVDYFDLSATYHPIDALSPRGDGLTLFSTTRGAVFFPAQKDRYRAIEPHIWADRAVTDVWPDVVAAASRAGIEVRPWVVALFQPWIADAHPQYRRVLPTGQAVTGSLCPSSAAVVDYTTALCADVAGQTGARCLRLEAISLPEITHQWVRPRVLVDLSPTVLRLLGLCFCAGCTTASTGAGVDVAGLQRRVCSSIKALVAGSTPADETPAIEALVKADEELGAYVRAERERSLQLVRRVASELADRHNCRVLLTTTPRDTLGPWDPAPLEALAGEVDGVIVHPLHNPTATERLGERRGRDGQPLTLSAFVVAGRVPLAGGATVTTGTDAELTAARAAGATEINVYNLGLVGPAALRSAVEAARVS